MHDGVAVPPAAGSLFLHIAFSQIWTPIVYIIGFVALWFHMNHGFWSMFQTCGWDNDIWIKRLKCIGLWWSSIVVALFIAQAIVFTVRANSTSFDEACRDYATSVVCPEAAVSQEAVCIIHTDCDGHTDCEGHGHHTECVK